MKKPLAALVQLRRALFPNCRETIHLQSQALDRPLSMIERCAIGFHLLYCKWCRRYGKQLRFLRLAVRHEECSLAPHSQATLSPEARQRIKEMLRAQG
jgi:hypothetical protein